MECQCNNVNEKTVQGESALTHSSLAILTLDVCVVWPFL